MMGKSPDVWTLRLFPHIDIVQRKSKLFYGWYIVAAGFVSLWINVGFGFYSFPVFLVEFTEYFGWGRGAANAGVSVTFVVGALASPIVGRLLPRLGAKKIIVAGALIMGVAFMLLSRMQTIRQFYALCLILAVGLACTGTMSTSYAVSDWFEKKRGTAMGVMMVGVGLGGLIIVPLTRLFIDVFRWQTTFVIYAVSTVLILVPIAGMVFKRRPAEHGVLPDGETSDPVETDAQAPTRPDPTAGQNGWIFRDAVRTRAFWFVVVAFIMATFGQTGLLINQVAYFQDIGISPERAAGALGLCAFLGIAGKLFFGAMADRYPARYAMALCFGLQAVGTVILLFTSAIGSPFLFVLVWGFAMGGVITLEPLIVGECFGMKSFGVILGMVYVCTTVGASLGPPFGGWMFDRSESYIAAFVVFIIAYALSTALSLLAVPPEPMHREA